jgi:hypothetical protein
VNESSLNHDQIAIRTGSAVIEISCPAWCEVSADQHASRMWENEGRCVHRAAVGVRDPAGKRAWDLAAPSYHAPFELVLLMTTNPRGREVESVDLLINGHDMSVEQAELVAATIAGLVATYRATPGRLEF